MPSYALSRTRALTLAAPANNWRWLARMPIVPGGPPATSVVADQIELVHRAIAPQPRFVGSMHQSYPTTSDVSSFSMSFYEDENYTATKYLYAWQALVIDEFGVHGMPVDYKKDILLEMYSITDQKGFTARLVGTWPSNVGNFSLSYNESGRLVVSCTFSADRVMVGNGASGTLTSFVGAGFEALMSGAASLLDSLA